MTKTWPSLLSALIAGTDLSTSDTSWVMDEVMSGQATPAQIAGFVIALRAKGETPAEIDGMADGMLAHSRRLSIEGPAVDIVGTGGDGSNSVNISTMSTLVVAAAGIPVVKHGNRAASSKTGGADVLEELGVAIELSPEAVLRCVTDLGVGFCFARAFHPSFRHAGPVRAQLGVPTAFNLLGPLTNPAQPSAALVGCAYADKLPVLADVFARRGTSALVVRGDDGLDELTTTTTSTAYRVSGGDVRKLSVDPAELGLARATADDLRGGSAADNAEVCHRLLAGDKGPVRDAVLLNAAGALAAFHGFSESLVEDLRRGLATAADAIDSGKAATLLADWARLSTSLAS